MKLLLRLTALLSLLILLTVVESCAPRTRTVVVRPTKTVVVRPARPTKVVVVKPARRKRVVVVAPR